MRRTKRFSILFFVLGFCSCLFLIGVVRFLSGMSYDNLGGLTSYKIKIKDLSCKVMLYPVGDCPDCKKITTIHWKVGPLNDNNDVHLAYAQKLGIEPFQTNADLESHLDSYLMLHKLKKIEDCDMYKLKSLTHSYPYLIPKAADLLDDIGKRFEEKLTKNGIGPYSMLISSVLRTKENQQGLEKHNSNAAPLSAHFYGTTFDISYKEFLPLHGQPVHEGYCRHDMLRYVLGEALTELSDEGRCKVVREKKQACFHITVAE